MVICYWWANVWYMCFPFVAARNCSSWFIILWKIVVCFIFRSLRIRFRVYEMGPNYVVFISMDVNIMSFFRRWHLLPILLFFLWIIDSLYISFEHFLVLGVAVRFICQIVVAFCPFLLLIYFVMFLLSKLDCS